MTSDVTPDSVSIAPWITVPDADEAVTFYVRALGAEQHEVLSDDSNKIMVAQLVIGGADFWIQAEPDAPKGDGGEPVRMILTVEDPDSLFDRAISAGATKINPMDEDHGWRIGRISDPFGNHWEIGKRVEDS